MQWENISFWLWVFVNQKGSKVIMERWYSTTLPFGLPSLINFRSCELLCNNSFRVRADKLRFWIFEQHVQSWNRPSQVIGHGAKTFWKLSVVFIAVGPEMSIKWRLPPVRNRQYNRTVYLIGSRSLPHTTWCYAWSQTSAFKSLR